MSEEDNESTTSLVDAVEQIQCALINLKNLKRTGMPQFTEVVRGQLIEALIALGETKEEAESCDQLS